VAQGRLGYFFDYDTIFPDSAELDSKLKSGKAIETLKKRTVLPRCGVMSSDLVISQQLLEQNEDIIAAIVENLQLGRLNDCMQHYSILQANLVSLATQLDNFPAEEFDPYSKLNIFPDELMRKDILEDLRPVGYRPVPEAALVPACADCTNRGVSNKHYH
jgi:hypothetical protein